MHKRVGSAVHFNVTHPSPDIKANRRTILLLFIYDLQYQPQMIFHYTTIIGNVFHLY